MQGIKTRGGNILVKQGGKVGIFSPEGKFLSVRTSGFFNFLKGKGETPFPTRGFKFPPIFMIGEDRGSEVVSNRTVLLIAPWDHLKKEYPNAELGVFYYEDNEPGGVLQYTERWCEKIEWEDAID